ncbi:MAG: VWA domain-containing protein [Clostridia bacterium]
MNKKIKCFCTLILIAIMLISTTVFAANEDVTLEKVKDDICKIELGGDGEVTRKLVSVSNEKKEIIIQVDAINLKSQEEEIEPSEIFLVIDNSKSMTENTLANGKTRKETVFEAAKTLATQILEAQPDTKIGVVSFSTNLDATKEGTIDDAQLVTEPTSEILEITTAIDSIEATGARTDIDAGLQVAKNNFSTDVGEGLNQYLILLTDGVPNTAVGGPTMTYSGEVTTKTKATLQSILDKNIDIVTVMTGVDSTYMPDADGMLSPDAAGKTYQDLAEEIFGTQGEPNYGVFYYVTDENVETTITEKVFDDIIKIVENSIKDITVIDYLPDNIVANYDFSIYEQPNIGEVSQNINLADNSLTWTIGKLEAGVTATFKYKLTLKEKFDEKILNVETPTNTKLDVTYTGTDDTEKSLTSDIVPSVKLTKDVTIAPEPIPQTGDSSFILVAGIVVLIAVAAICVKKFGNKY